MNINDRPIETPVRTQEQLKVESVQATSVKGKYRPLTAAERRKKTDRRKRQLRWHGKFDMRTGRDRRRRDSDTPPIDLDV